MRKAESKKLVGSSGRLILAKLTILLVAHLLFGAVLIYSCFLIGRHFMPEHSVLIQAVIPYAGFCVESALILMLAPKIRGSVILVHLGLLNWALN